MTFSSAIAVFDTFLSFSLANLASYITFKVVIDLIQGNLFPVLSIVENLTCLVSFVYIKWCIGMYEEQVAWKYEY